MAFDASQSSYVALKGILSENTKPVVAWVGAGLSAPAGLPTWAQLQTRLVNSLRDRARTLNAAGRADYEKKALAIAQERDLWIAMKLAKQAGAESFASEIRDALKASDTASIPNNYLKLWKLNLRGVINLNIDRLAVRSFEDSRAGTSLAVISNSELHVTFSKMRARLPFVVQLHGSLDDSHSWVFTHDDLKKLQENQTYRLFVTNCLSTNAVIFIGISPDDQAIQPHLKFLRECKVEVECFWFTHRKDAATDAWAEDHGLRVIRYSDANNHLELAEALQEIVDYVPVDTEDFDPVIDTSCANTEEPIPSESVLMSKDANTIRVLLNAHAGRLLRDGSDEAYTKFTNFCAEYEEAVDRAYFVTANPPKNKLMHYTLERLVEEGAFGKVFEATDDAGERVAVKVLHERIRDKLGFLKCFRRGVNSMRILESGQCKGMVRFYAASEIPAFVAMEWIDGPTLKTAVESGAVDDWSLILKIAAELSETLKTAHALPQRVLHRDLRPSNIMLRGFYTAPDSWQTIVLDFDLSWHRGAVEESIAYSPYAGYLAPEQVQKTAGVSTRNAAVDSFGFGMTLYYMVSGREPGPGTHNTAEWMNVVRDAAKRFGGAKWKSLPERAARLIHGASRNIQHERWDMSQIFGEVRALRELQSDKFELVTASNIAEEIVCRSRLERGYVWSHERGVAESTLQGGISVTVSGDDARERIRLEFDWSDSGDRERRNIGKYVMEASDRVVQALTSNGWEKVKGDKGSGQLHVSASINSDSAIGNLDRLAAGIDKAVIAINF